MDFNYLETSWFEFAKKIFEYSNEEVKVIPISTEEFGSKLTYSHD